MIVVRVVVVLYSLRYPGDEELNIDTMMEERIDTGETKARSHQFNGNYFQAQMSDRAVTHQATRVHIFDSSLIVC